MKIPRCDCLAIRQAARHVTQFYDPYLARTGLRTTQYSILVNVHRLAPVTIHALAVERVIDRTTLGRNIVPLERDGLMAIGSRSSDRRSKALHLTPAGMTRLCHARKVWADAQGRFESAWSGARAADRRAELHAFANSGFQVDHPVFLTFSAVRFLSE